MPTPKPDAAPAAPAAAPEAAPILADSAVNAEAAASHQVQATIAAEEAAAAAPAEQPPATEATPAPAPIESVGNAVFDQVGKLLADKGHADPTAILAGAAEGELSLEARASLVESLGPDIANLVVSQLEGEVTKQRESVAQEAEAQKKYANEQLGVEDGGWEQLKEFANSDESGYSDGDRQALDSMLREGGVKAQWAIDQIVSRTQKSQGFTQVPHLLSGDGPTTAGFEPLTKAGYVEEMRKVQFKYGEGSREVEALRNRRAQSIQRGY
jgi:hypothetical protein